MNDSPGSGDSPPHSLDEPRDVTCRRRRLLQIGGLGLVGTLAGCAGFSDNGDTQDLQFDQLHTTAVYVDDSVELSMPTEIETVTAKTNADLLVFPDDVDTGAEQVADWFDDGRAVALLGPDSEATWLEWARSDEFEQRFENKGFGDSDPDPQLLVGVAFDLRVATYRRSWADGPRDRDVLRALDETLVSIEERTPAETSG